MIIVCDIGNTNITLGLCEGRRLVSAVSLSTKRVRGFRQFLRTMLSSKHLTFTQIEACMICSVVPEAAKIIERAFRSIPLYVLGKNVKVPLKNLYAHPEQVGQDRLVCAYMAMKLYGAPVISIDLGTALTFDVVSKNKEYLGGIIVPGVKLALLALHRYTALLPKVALVKAGCLIGKNTKESMLSGVTFGYGGFIDAMVEKLKKELGRSASAVLTGGDSQFLTAYCKKVDYTHPCLILEGMLEIMKQGKKIAKNT